MSRSLSRRLKTVSYETVVPKPVSNIHSQRGKIAANIYFPLRQVQHTAQISCNVQLARPKQATKQYQPTQMGQVLSVVQPLRKLSEFEIEPQQKTASVVTQEGMCIQICFYVEILESRSCRQTIPSKSQRLPGHSLAEKSFRAPAIGASSASKIMVKPKDYLKLNFRKEEVKRFIRFMTEQDETKMEIPISQQCTEPQFQYKFSMVEPEFQRPYCLVKQDTQNTLKRLGQSPPVKVSKTGKAPYLNPLASEKHIPAYCESEPPDPVMGLIYIDKQILTCGPASNLTQVLLSPPAQKTKDRIPKTQKAKTGQPQKVRSITFTFKEKAEPPSTQPALQVEYDEFKHWDEKVEIPSSRTSDRKKEQPPTYKIIHHHETKFVSPIQNICVEQSNGGRHSSKKHQRKGAHQSEQLTTRFRNVRFEPRANTDLVMILTQEQQLFQNIDVWYIQEQYKQDDVQKELENQIVALEIETLKRTNKAAASAMQSKLVLRDVYVQNYYNDYAGEVRLKLKDPRDASGTDPNDVMIQNLQTEAGTFIQCLQDLRQREETYGNPEVDKILAVIEAEAGFGKIVAQSNLTLLTRRLIELFDKFRASVIISVTDLKLTNKNFDELTKAFMKLILQRKEAINKKKALLKVNDPQRELKLEKLNKLLAIEEDIRKYVISEKNINQLWASFEKYKQSYSTTIDL